MSLDVFLLHRNHLMRDYVKKQYIHSSKLDNALQVDEFVILKARQGESILIDQITQIENSINNIAFGDVTDPFFDCSSTVSCCIV